MGLKFAFGAIALALAVPQAAHAQIQSVQLEPSSEWKFESRSETCRISRTFGEGETETALTIDQGGTEERYNLSLTGDYVSKPFGSLLDIRFGDLNKNTNSHKKSTSSDGKTSLKVSGLTIAPAGDTYDSDAPPTVLTTAEKAEITTLHVSWARPRPFILAIGPMSEQLAALQLCANDLAVRLDAASQDGLDGSLAPVPIEPSKWLWARDLPQDLWLKQKGGSLSFRLTVNPEGSATHCKVLNADSSSMLKARMCTKLLESAKFQPARDRAGQITAAYYYSAITFQIKK